MPHSMASPDAALAGNPQALALSPSLWGCAFPKAYLPITESNTPVEPPRQPSSCDSLMPAPWVVHERPTSLFCQPLPVQGSGRVRAPEAATPIQLCSSQQALTRLCSLPPHRACQRSTFAFSGKSLASMYLLEVVYFCVRYWPHTFLVPPLPN